LKVKKKIQRDSGTETTMNQVCHYTSGEVGRNSMKGKGKSKVHPVTGHEGPEVQ